MSNIEYFEDTHQYLIDGIIVPSVSKLVAYATGEIYKDIPEFILEKARIHGTECHNAVEDYERTGLISTEHQYEVEAYIELKEKYNLVVKDMEQIVAYVPYYCGRYDIQDINEDLWDMKFTSKFHKENLEWQLGFYYLGKGVEKEKGYCIHIPNIKYGKPKVHLIKPKTNKECKEIAETYALANKSASNKSEDQTISLD